MDPLAEQIEFLVDEARYNCSLAGERVKIGGNAVLYMKGEVYVEAKSGKSAGV